MERSFSINNLDCANCGAKIERAISRIEGVESAVLNFPMKKLKIHGKFNEEILDLIYKAARKIEPDVELIPLSEQHTHEHNEHEHEHHHEHCCCEHEHEHEHNHEHCCDEHEHHHEHCCEHEHGHEYSDIHGQEFVVENLGCAHCGGKIEEALNKLEGVESAVLNFPMKKFIIKGNVDDILLARMNEIAGSIEAGVVIRSAAEKSHSHEHEHEHEESLSHEIIPVIIGIALLAAAVAAGRLLDVKPVSIGLYAAAYLTLGWGVLKATVKNVRSRNFFDENTLMTVATIGAFALGEFSEAVGVMLFFRIGEMFEHFAVARSRKAITDVAGLKVEEADVLIDGEFRRVSSDTIKAGDILRIKAGERIAADGVIESGESRIDTSAVNGEPVPVSVRAGDAVMSGCINLSDTFTLRCTAAADDSMMAKVARAVEDASAGKPKIDRFITRFARVYTPIVIAIAALTAVVPSLITGDWSKWVYAALTFLVISCPCALVLSVPLAYFSGIGAASKLGILFKGGDSVEALGKVKAIAFDKTGTLTNGSFNVTEIRTCGELSEEELLRICGSCEQASTHPVAESITACCRERGISLAEPEKVSEIAGRGVLAVIGGKETLCGNERLMSEKNIAMPVFDEKNGSVVFIAVNGRIQGRIVVSDTIKKTSAGAMAALKKMGVHTAMFTGDKTENADSVGKALGVETVRGELLPDGKLEEICSLREKYGAVMFVGDGINDGPVLAGADVGGAMQSGADLALEAADAVFMNSEPEAVVKAKRIADKALRVSYENIGFALAVKLAVLVLGLIGMPSMWFAVFADSGTAMLLILNSIRVLNTKKY
ncbi:MAG: cadmium-translocating P-type ATPase [Ruminococcus sp.]|nr:cadmium-translocating P-type ATPase [Ruminococcus sp.]